MKLLACAVLLAALAGAEVQPVSVRIEPQARTLRGADASQQYLVLAKYPDGVERDVTDTAQLTVSDPAVATVEPTGRLHARADGTAKLTATVSGHSATAELTVQEASHTRDFQFGREIGGILTRKGCNGAACHGGVKGRGGLKLSSGALYPKDDYEWIVKGGAYQVLSAEVKGERVPRVDLKQPEKSLILQKATGAVPHGGGPRFKRDSAEYNALIAWIRKGAPFGADTPRENRVARLELFPSTIAMESGGQHRLLVTALFTDGSTEDFTHQALYVPTDKNVVTVDESGKIKAAGLGETAVLVRAAGQAMTATVGVIGSPVANYPNVPRYNFIDEFVFDKLRKFRIVPAELSSDTEFLRRVCLDLTGTLPPPERVREFVANKDPKKRTKVIDALISSPEFVDYWTFRFDDIMRVAATSNGIHKWSDSYGDWIRDSIAKNRPYNEMARERLAAQGYSGPSRHYLPYNVIGPPAEQMAEEVRVFFGRRLNCAQCHNHPYESWSQDQFWGLTAFFGRLHKMGDNNDYVIFDHPDEEPLGNSDVNADLKLYHPRTKAVLKPSFLDGTQIKATARQNPRRFLADWMVQHPYFAEATVNRIWSQFFGRGIVDPVDDFRSTNPPTHPELLEKLADHFRRNNHDLRELMRTIVSSRTYQLSGRTNATNRADRTNYSHAQPRPMDAEVLLDAICDVTGVPEVFTVGIPTGTNPPVQLPKGTRAVALRQPDVFYSRFLELYGRPTRLTFPERSGKANLKQALHMLAGPVYNEKLASPDGRIQRLIQSGRSDSEIIDEIYMAALSRMPDREEKVQLQKLISASVDRNEALKDMAWAILCSREFAENH